MPGHGACSKAAGYDLYSLACPTKLCEQVGDHVPAPEDGPQSSTGTGPYPQLGAEDRNLILTT